MSQTIPTVPPALFRKLDETGAVHDLRESDERSRRAVQPAEVDLDQQRIRPARAGRQPLSAIISPADDVR